MLEDSVRDAISKERRLTVGATQSGVRVHTLPQHPRDINDDGEFHYATLGPSFTSESGKPSPEAKKFLEEHTGPNKPRVYRNAVLLAVPSRVGLDLLRERVREHLAWLEVAGEPAAKVFDDYRRAMLKGFTDAALGKIPDAGLHAYNIVVTFSAKAMSRPSG